MTDPFPQLRRPVERIDPDPRYAAELRARLARALVQTETPTRGPAMTQLIPYLSVRDARAAIDWYTDAFGARLVEDPYVMDDDRIGHAALEIGDAMLFLADEHPELGLTGPREGAVSVSLHLSVGDVDGAVERARGLGATVERPPADAPYGRTGVVLDPYGHRWMLQARHAAPAEVRPPVRPGDAVYLTLQVPDGARARDFYGAVLGWSAVPGSIPDGWQVEGPVPMVGIGGGSDEPGMVPMYAVDDLEVAVMSVTAAGGRAGEIERQPYGLTALCRDDQGLPFYLGQLS
jgi:uncharacterized glyoxalase superfamily protein PhnB